MLQDYEYANDQRGVAGYEAASPAEEMDYALHDAGKLPILTILSGADCEQKKAALCLSNLSSSDGNRAEAEQAKLKDQNSATPSSKTTTLSPVGSSSLQFAADITPGW